LPKNEYSCKNEPSQSSAQGGSAKDSKKAAAAPTTSLPSNRSRRTANWGRSRTTSDDGYSR